MLSNEFIGVFLVLISSLWYGLFNALSSRENETGWKYQLIAIQYSVNLLIWIGLLTLFWIGHIGDFHFQEIWVLLIGWIAGYTGIYSLFSGIQNAWPTLTMLIGNSYIIILFFWNIVFYGGNEMLSITKIILGSIFIIGIGYLVWDTRSEKKISTKKLFFPIATGISWMIYSWTSTYIIKQSILSPLTTLVALEGIITFIALIIFFYKNTSKISTKTLRENISWMKIFLWILLALAGMTWFFAYKFLPANIVNILLMSQNITTIACMAIILKRQYPLKEWTIIAIMTGILMGFIFF